MNFLVRTRCLCAELIAGNVNYLKAFAAALLVYFLNRPVLRCEASLLRRVDDKYDLAAWIYNQEFDAAFKIFCASRDFEAFVYRCVEILFEDETFYRNALKNFVGQNSFRYATNDYAIKSMAAWLSTRCKLSAELSCCLWFYMRAVSETINDWFLGSRELSARELAKLLVEWMPAPLKPLLLHS